MTHTSIDGRTRLVGLIGDPVEHSLSPQIHNAAFQALNLNWCYIPLPVEKKYLAKALSGIVSLGFAGVNITMPHKEDVIPFLDEVGSYAQIVKAVNTIRIQSEKLIGFNTDGRGFITSLESDSGYSPHGKNAVIIGAGGAARAIAVSLSLSEINHLTVVNRTLSRAEDLCQLIRQHFPSQHVEALALESDLSSAFETGELVVNATSVGMAPNVEETPISPDLIKKSHFIYDLIYQPRETLLLKVARKKGAQVLNGLGMLLHQAAASFEIWTGKEAPIEVMKTVLEEHL